jgi:hypothetical protein
MPDGTTSQTARFDRLIGSGLVFRTKRCIPHLIFFQPAVPDGERNIKLSKTANL